MNEQASRLIDIPHEMPAYQLFSERVNDGAGMG